MRTPIKCEWDRDRNKRWQIKTLNAINHLHRILRAIVSVYAVAAHLWLDWKCHIHFGAISIFNNRHLQRKHSISLSIIKTIIKFLSYIYIHHTMCCVVFCGKFMEIWCPNYNVLYVYVLKHSIKSIDWTKARKR